ncbi:MAG: twitching motility protein PilT [Anaerolineae bacterium]|nr:twitching motility protein PilT [Anaerolineae bacterium]
MTTLYLDMNINNRPFDDQGQMRIRLETTAITMVWALIQSGTFAAKWSFVLDYENSRNPFVERRAFAHYLAQACEGTIEPNEGIREMARRLERLEIRGRDALHLACAEWAGCDYLVTCDDQLVQQGKRLVEAGELGLKVINPVDLLREEKRWR